MRQLITGLLGEYADEYEIKKITDEVKAKTNYEISYQIPRDNDYARALYIHEFYNQLSSQKQALLNMPKSEFQQRAILVSSRDRHLDYVNSFKSNFAAVIGKSIASEFVSENSKTDFKIQADGNPLSNVFGMRAVEPTLTSILSNAWKDGNLEDPRLVQEGEQYFLEFKVKDEFSIRVNDEKKTYAPGEMLKVEVQEVTNSMMSAFNAVRDHNESKEAGPSMGISRRRDNGKLVSASREFRFPLTTGYHYEGHVTSGDNASIGISILKDGVAPYPQNPDEISKQQAQEARLMFIHIRSQRCKLIQSI